MMIFCRKSKLSFIYSIRERLLESFWRKAEACARRQVGSPIYYCLDYHLFYFDCSMFLAHLCRMDLPTLISRTCAIPIVWALGGIFRFCPNSERTFCKQTVETLIRRRVLRRLVWIYTVCLCPTKRTLGLYGLNPDRMIFVRPV